MDEIIAIAVLIGLIPALIASSKGHSLILWWIFGAALWIVAFPMSLLLKNQSGKQCPSCKEFVDVQATICKHCRSTI